MPARHTLKTTNETARVPAIWFHTYWSNSSLSMATSSTQLVSSASSKTYMRYWPPSGETATSSSSSPLCSMLHSES